MMKIVQKHRKKQWTLTWKAGNWVMGDCWHKKISGAKDKAPEKISVSTIIYIKG